MTGNEITIEKAVVPAGGRGRRMTPITDIVPKEMFPIGAHPAIEWVIAEAVASGCTDVAVVISPRKRIIEEYLAKCCPGLADLCRLTFLVQTEPRGLAHALLLASEFCTGRPFAVLLPDDLVDAPQPPLMQMIKVFSAKAGAVLAITEEPAENAIWYRRPQLRQVSERVYKVERIPRERTSMPAGATSLLLGVGRYLLSPEFLNHASVLFDRRSTGELDDGMILQRMIDAGEPVHAVHIHGRRYNVSTPDGLIAALQRFGKESPPWKCL